MKGKIRSICPTTLATLTALALSVSGCSEGLWSSRNKLDESPLAKFGQKKIEDDAKAGKADSAYDAGHESLFSLGSQDGGIFGGGSSKRTEQIRADKLFAGALDVVLGLPIQVASREGGLVSTEWKIDPENPSDRFRLNIRVSGKDPYGEVKVAVLKQTLANGIWQDAISDPSMADNIAKKIRKQAEEVRP
ncbi:MAG: DUF3576 domain-containing protein [Magnetococcales bacterium]|nr:DUF3576 domain-containing protein [Magnetococcales bacterium]